MLATLRRTELRRLRLRARPKTVTKTGVFSGSMPSREYSKLVEALRLCALPYEGQAGALPAFVLVPAEVGIEFFDAYRAASKAGRLPMRGNRSIRQLDALFVEMGNATDREWLFSIDAMQRDARWERSRQLATKALAALHEPLKRPKFPDSTWIGKSSTGETIEVRGDAVPEPD